MDKNELTEISKYLSFILRHQPDAIGLELDEQGWGSVSELISKTSDLDLSENIIRIVVETNDKQRFSLSENGCYIRANQGHSINVDLGYIPQVPPKTLLHGTAERFLSSIMSNGLRKESRHHVHLTESEFVAQTVGCRYGKLVLLEVNTEQMYEDGYEFYQSLNNVWLVEGVPQKYLKNITKQSR